MVQRLLLNFIWSILKSLLPFLSHILFMLSWVLFKSSQILLKWGYLLLLLMILSLMWSNVLLISRYFFVERVQLLGQLFVWESQFVVYYFILLVVGQVIDGKVIFVHKLVLGLFLPTELQTVQLWHLVSFWLSLSS